MILISVDILLSQLCNPKLKGEAMHFVILKGSPLVQMQLTWLKGSSQLPHSIFFPTVKHALKYTCIFEAVRG